MFFAIIVFAIVFPLVSGYFSPTYLCAFVCVCIRDRERDCIGEILYLISHFQGNCAKQGYVRITGQPEVTVESIHLL